MVPKGSDAITKTQKGLYYCPAAPFSEPICLMLRSMVRLREKSGRHTTFRGPVNTLQFANAGFTRGNGHLLGSFLAELLYAEGCFGAAAFLGRPGGFPVPQLALFSVCQRVGFRIVRVCVCVYCACVCVYCVCACVLNRTAYAWWVDISQQSRRDRLSQQPVRGFCCRSPCQ